MSDLQQKIAAARHRIAVDLTPDEVSDALASLHVRARQRVWRRRGAGGALVLAAVAVFLLAIARRDNPEVARVVPAATRAAPPAVPAVPPARPAAQEPAAPDAAPAPLVYRDGSRATPLAPRSQVRLREQQATLMQTEVVFGGGRFEVAKDPQRRFQVLAGALVVEAIGTVFTVERAPEEVWVSVHEGRVRVSGPGIVAVLEASERRRFHTPMSGVHDAVGTGPAPRETRPRAPTQAALAAKAGPGPDASERAVEPARLPAERRSLQPPPVVAPPVIQLPVVQAPPVAPAGDPVDESLRRADQARAARHYGAAASQLRQVVQQTSDTRAPLAAFTLARLLLEKLNQPAEAARTFAEVQRLAPEGDLAEDALAREVESWRTAGLAVAARERAGTYLQRYPQGRRRDEVRRLGGVP